MANARDVVCGMDVDTGTASQKSEYQGQTYYFCSPGCKTQFDRDPQRYAGSQSGQQQQGGHSH